MSTTVHEAERMGYATYATRAADEEYRVRNADLYATWEVFNATYFAGRLAAPHIMIGRTAPRSLGHVDPTTDYGGRLQITFNDRLLFGTDGEWVIRPWPATGIRRFIHDLLLRFTTRQDILEHRGAEERGYRGFGPLFAAEANRVGATLGLGPVVARRRGGNEPLAANWPHAVRPDGYYGDDLTEALLDLAAGTRNAGRRNPAPPDLGVFEYLQFLLRSGRDDRALALVDRHVDWLRRVRDRKVRRRNSRVERGELDVDGETLLGDVEFDRAWLFWNGETVRHIAEAADEQRDYSPLPILADAMEEAGCDDGRILRHLRAPIEHTRHCWVVRRLLQLTFTP